jgi:hypothetical protein
MSDTLQFVVIVREKSPLHEKSPAGDDRQTIKCVGH